MLDSLIPQNIFEVIKDLKLKKIFTTKQLKYIESVFFYIEDLTIYKFVIAVRPEMLKKAKKVGLNSLFDIHDNINIKIKEPISNTSNGRFILIWNISFNEIMVAEGEDKNIH